MSMTGTWLDGASLAPAASDDDARERAALKLLQFHPPAVDDVLIDTAAAYHRVDPDRLAQRFKEETGLDPRPGVATPASARPQSTRFAGAPHAGVPAPTSPAPWSASYPGQASRTPNWDQPPTDVRTHVAQVYGQPQSPSFWGRFPPEPKFAAMPPVDETAAAAAAFRDAATRIARGVRRTAAPAATQSSMPTTTAERPQLDPDTARHVWSLIARPERRQYGMQLYNALMTPQPNGAGMHNVRPWAMAAFEKTLEPITSYPETYARMNREGLEQAKHGLFGQIVPSFRAAATPSPAGMSEEEIRRRHAAGAVELVKGIGNLGFGTLGYAASPINAAFRTLAGKPTEENFGIPKEYTEFALGLGLPGVGWARWGGARPPTFPVAAPGATRRSVSEGRWIPPEPSEIAPAPHILAKPGPMFDYSRLSNVPNVPQFDLQRYVPSRGIPARTQALASSENVARVNDVARRGAQRGGLEWYNTEPLRERFIAELGLAKGQAEFAKYMNLVAATSPRNPVGLNIRNASYYYGLDAQGLPFPRHLWDGGKWTLVDRLPRLYWHPAAPLHVLKANEVLIHGGLNPLRNPKLASFSQNLQGNLTPVTIDVHNARLWGVRNAQGSPAAAPAKTEYGYLERLQQDQAAKMGMTPGQYQASAWIGGADQTGVLRSSTPPWLRSFEHRVELTAADRGLSKEEVLRRFIRGELPLLSLAGAAAFQSADEQ